MRECLTDCGAVSRFFIVALFQVDGIVIDRFVCVFDHDIVQLDDSEREYENIIGYNWI